MEPSRQPEASRTEVEPDVQFRPWQQPEELPPSFDDSVLWLADRVREAQPDLRDVPRDEIAAVLSELSMPDLEALGQLATIVQPLGIVVSWAYRQIRDRHADHLPPPPPPVVPLPPRAVEARVYPQHILAAMCRAHIQKTYHGRASIASFKTRVKRLTPGSDIGPDVRYEVRVYYTPRRANVERKTYVFEINADASVTWLYLLQRSEEEEEEEYLDLPNWTTSSWY